MRAKIFWGSVGTIMTCLLAYVFFVQSSVYYILSANEMNTVLKTQSSHLATLESTYYELGSTLDLAEAHTLGFVDVAETHFIQANVGDGLVSFTSR